MVVINNQLAPPRFRNGGSLLAFVYVKSEMIYSAWLSP